MKINNMPEYAKKYRYIVVRQVDMELWFYGAYSTEEKAREAAGVINGVVVDMEE